MDLQYFLNILWRRKWLILSVMIISALSTWYFVDRKPDTYKSYTTITTNILGQEGLNPNENNPWLMEYLVKMGFENIKEFIKSRSNINFLSFRLLLHDLTADSLITGAPFRRIADMDQPDLEYTEDQINQFLSKLRLKLELLEFTFDSPAEDKMFKDLASTLYYDYESILKYNFVADRVGDTDNIRVEFESENPLLSAYAVNVFVDDFLRNHRFVRESDDLASVHFLRGEVAKKAKHMNQLKTQLNEYKSKRNLYDAGKEAQGIINRHNELTLDLEKTKSEIPALRKGIAGLNQLIKQKQNSINQTKSAEIENNQAINNMKAQLRKYNERRISSNYTDKEAERMYKIIQKNLQERIIKESKIYERKDKTPDNERSEEDLFQKKTDLALELNKALERVKTIERELQSLSGQQSSLVTDDGVINNLLSEIDLAEKEYEALLGQFNKEDLVVKEAYQPLKVIEHARVAEKAEPKMKLILSGFAGVVGGVLSTVAIFLMAFFDTSVNSPNKFSKFTDLNLVGTVNKIKTNNLDLKYLFSSNGQNKELDNFKESLRNIRYTIENSNAKKILFTSTKKAEGKTFLIVTLAHALTIKHKKILIIDTNFKNNSLSQMSKKTIQDNVLNSNWIGENDLSKAFISQSINSQFNLDNVDIIGNNGTFQSPSEVFADKDFQRFVEGLADQYDYIFMEGAPLNNYSDTKELVAFADKVIAVFAAESEIKAADENSIRFLKTLGSKFMGAILNKIDLKDLN